MIGAGRLVVRLACSLASCVTRLTRPTHFVGRLATAVQTLPYNGPEVKL